MKALTKIILLNMFIVISIKLATKLLRHTSKQTYRYIYSSLMQLNALSGVLLSPFINLVFAIAYFVYALELKHFSTQNTHFKHLQCQSKKAQIVFCYYLFVFMYYNNF